MSEWGFSTKPIRERAFEVTSLLRRPACKTGACHAFLTLCALFPLWACDRGERVVVYTSLDEEYSRPILEAFEAETGIPVDAVYDVEAQKTTGLFHRLLREHESGRPRADVFWNSEVARTLQLDAAGVLAPYTSPNATEIPEHLQTKNWAGFGARARIIVYNTDLISTAEAPRSIRALADPRYRGRAGIALPLAGTTATHVGALWAVLGAEETKRLLESFLANEVRVLDGNSVVRDRVATGEIAIGLTDTDDAVSAIRRGLPLGIVFPDQPDAGPYPGRKDALGALLIPNTIAMVSGRPASANARQLVDYVLSKKTEAALARADSAQIPVRPDVTGPQMPGYSPDLLWMNVDFEAIARGVVDSRTFIEERFVK